MKKSVLKWTIVDDVFLSCATEGKMEDHLWDSYTRALTEGKFKAHLGASLGAVDISSLQRKAGAEAVKATGAKVAVVTDERLVRGIITAISWLGVDVKSFPWSDLRKALQYLGVTKPVEERCILELNQLRALCMNEAARQK